jgi:hypothetical protein
MLKKLKRHMSRGNDQISAELVNAGGGIIPSDIHKIVNSIRKKESIIVPAYKKGDEPICNKYRGISLN